MDSALLPCPFCGEAASVEREGTGSRSMIVSCDWCGCRVESGDEDGHYDAWNLRDGKRAEPDG